MSLAPESSVNRRRQSHHGRARIDTETRRGQLTTMATILRPNQIAPHSPTRLIGDPAYPLVATREMDINNNNNIYCQQQFRSPTLRAARKVKGDWFRQLRFLPAGQGGYQPRRARICTEPPCYFGIIFCILGTNIALLYSSTPNTKDIPLIFAYFCSEAYFCFISLIRRLKILVNLL